MFSYHIPADFPPHRLDRLHFCCHPWETWSNRIFMLYITMTNHFGSVLLFDTHKW